MLARLTSEDRRALRREAMRKLPALLGRVIIANVAGVYAILFITGGASGPRPGVPAPSVTPSVAWIAHPTTLAIWAAIPTILIWVFHRSMIIASGEHEGRTFATPLVAAAMTAAHLACVGCGWLVFRQ